MLGHNGLNAVLNLGHLNRYIDAPPPDDLERAFSFNDMATLHSAMETMYGVKGRRVMQNIGQVWLREGIQSFGALAGMSDPKVRALPATERGHLALLALADVFTRFSDQTCRVETEADAWRLVVENSGVAFGRQSDRPVCVTMVGLLEETLPWATDGQHYPVQEHSCMAMGAPGCLFEIKKQPTG